MGRAAPQEKCPRTPARVFREVSFSVQLWKFPQKIEANHFHPLLMQAHTWSDGPKVEKVDFLVQSQHLPTCLQAQLVGRLSVELIIFFSVGLFFLLFRPPNARSYVDQYIGSPSISWLIHV